MNNETAPIRVALVDDHGLCRRGLADLLTNRYGIQVVGATDSPVELDALLVEQKPDLVVMDLRMDPISGLQLLEKIRKDGHQTPVVILTMSDAESDLASALRAGVRGYLLKDMTPDDVVDGIRRVAAGEMVVATSMTAKMIGILQKGGTKEDYQISLKQLTDREQEILELLADGSTNKAIARTLGISNDTVKQHVRHILNKLNLSSRVEAAVLYAVEQKSIAKGTTT
ncbi:MAG: response regulator [Burkholderiales bacterium]|nr:response regulator transcription factor [Ferrovum sp.]